MKAATKAGKKKNLLTPTTFSLLHATDFADRLLYKIIPPLKAGMIVLADRYCYTAFARDVARGVDRAVGARPLRLRRQARPRAVLPRADRGVARPPARPAREAEVLRGRHGHGLSTQVDESFRLFQGKVLEEYDRLVDEFGLQVVDAAGSITEQQRTGAAARGRTSGGRP